MDTYEASFEINSRTDAYAVERLVEQLYDALREESRTLREGSDDSRDMLTNFEEILDATKKHKPGTLTVIYKQSNEGFDGHL